MAGDTRFQAFGVVRGYTCNAGVAFGFSNHERILLGNGNLVHGRKVEDGLLERIMSSKQKSDVFWIEVFPSLRQVFVLMEDASIRIHDLVTGETIKALSSIVKRIVKRQCVSCFGFSSSGKFIYHLSGSHSLRMIDFSSANLDDSGVVKVAIPKDYDNVESVSIALSHAGNLACVAFSDGRVCMIDVDSTVVRAQRQLFEGGGDSILPFCFVAGSRAFIATESGRLGVWDYESNHVAFGNSGTQLSSIAPCPGGSDRLFTVGADGHVCQWTVGRKSVTKTSKEVLRRTNQNAVRPAFYVLKFSECGSFVSRVLVVPPPDFCPVKAAVQPVPKAQDVTICVNSSNVPGILSVSSSGRSLQAVFSMGSPSDVTASTVSLFRGSEDAADQGCVAVLTQEGHLVHAQLFDPKVDFAVSGWSPEGTSCDFAAGYVRVECSASRVSVCVGRSHAVLVGETGAHSSVFDCTSACFVEAKRLVCIAGGKITVSEVDAKEQVIELNNTKELEIPSGMLAPTAVFPGVQDNDLFCLHGEDHRLWRLVLEKDSLSVVAGAKVRLNGPVVDYARSEADAVESRHIALATHDSLFIIGGQKGNVVVPRSAFGGSSGLTARGITSIMWVGQVLLLTTELGLFLVDGCLNMDRLGDLPGPFAKLVLFTDKELFFAVPRPGAEVGGHFSVGMGRDEVKIVTRPFDAAYAVVRGILSGEHGEEEQGRLVRYLCSRPKVVSQVPRIRLLTLADACPDLVVELADESMEELPFGPLVACVLSGQYDNLKDYYKKIFSGSYGELSTEVLTASRHLALHLETLGMEEESRFILETAGLFVPLAALIVRADDQQAAKSLRGKIRKRNGYKGLSAFLAKFGAGKAKADDFPSSRLESLPVGLDYARFFPANTATLCYDDGGAESAPPRAAGEPATTVEEVSVGQVTDKTLYRAALADGEDATDTQDVEENFDKEDSREVDEDGYLPQPDLAAEYNRGFDTTGATGEGWSDEDESETRRRRPKFVIKIKEKADSDEGSNRPDFKADFGFAVNSFDQVGTLRPEDTPGQMFIGEPSRRASVMGTPGEAKVTSAQAQGANRHRRGQPTGSGPSSLDIDVGELQAEMNTMVQQLSPEMSPLSKGSAPRRLALNASASGLRAVAEEEEEGEVKQAASEPQKVAPATKPPVAQRRASPAGEPDGESAKTKLDQIFALMQRGEFALGLKKSTAALEACIGEAKVHRSQATKARTTVASNYKLALQILVIKGRLEKTVAAIRDEKQLLRTRIRISLLCIHLSRLALQGRHRVIATTMAATSCVAVQNYGTCAKVIDALFIKLPPHATAPATLSKLRMDCHSHSEADKHSLPIVACGNCGEKRLSVSDGSCLKCNAPLRICFQSLQPISSSEMLVCSACRARFVPNKGTAGEQCTFCNSGLLKLHSMKDIVSAERRRRAKSNV